ncbi:MAG: DUF4410 domain-containing protein [Pseudomonadota bacterium]
MKPILTAFCVLALTACGSTGPIKPAEGEEGAQSLDFSSYDQVIVRAFADGTKKQNMPETAGRLFADIIAAEVRSTGEFESVQVDDGEGRAIVIGGDVTRYARGNGAMKFLVGLGAGSTHFEAEVTFVDSETGETLGNLSVDKNSWALGGAIAASQSVEDFMTAAARKIAKEMSQAATDE